VCASASPGTTSRESDPVHLHTLLAGCRERVEKREPVPEEERVPAPAVVEPPATAGGHSRVVPRSNPRASVASSMERTVGRPCGQA